MTSPGVGAKQYGTAQGYSEDYSMKETTLQPAVDEYSNGRDAANWDAPPAAAPPSNASNPFTQKAATNPFAR